MGLRHERRKLDGQGYAICGIALNRAILGLITAGSDHSCFCFTGMAILGGGLAGIILARRGIFRRTLLGTAGAGIVAANLYPEDYQKYKKETSKLVCGTVKDTTGEQSIKEVD